MSWLRIDDRFSRHPKLLALTPAQRWTWIDLLCWASQYTDVAGVIPTHADQAVAGLSRLRHALRELGLLDVRDDGQDAIHDWYLYAHLALDEKVEWYLGENPDATANDVVRQLGGNRNAVLAAVKRYHEKHSESGIEPGISDTNEVVSSLVPNLVYDPTPNTEKSKAGALPFSAASPNKRRERDHVWDAAERLFGPITNPKERGKRNDAVKALRDSLAVHHPDAYEHEMRWRKDVLEASWGKPCTPHALATNWHQAERIATFEAPPDPHRRPNRSVARVDDLRDTAQRVLERFTPAQHTPDRTVIELEAM